MTGFEFRLLLIAAALTVCAAVLAAGESSLARVTRIRAQQLVADRRRGSAQLLRIVSESPPYLAVSTFVRVMCESFAAVLVTITAVSAIQEQWLALAVAAAAMVVVSFVLVGVSPRTLGRQHAEVVALLCAPLMWWLRRVLGPVARLLVLLGNAVTPGPGLRDGPFSSEVELRELLDVAGQDAVIAASERQMLHSVFELGDTMAREVMVPRTDMVTIDQDQVLRQALALFLRSGFSRIPVVGEGADDIRGVLYLKDVSKQVFRDAASEQSSRVTSVMRSAYYVPETKPIDELLRQMQRDQSHMAIVIDEYGGTAGLITIEDILEEIVGEITDEYDREDIPIEYLADGSVRVRALLHLDELGELFGRRISDDDVDTVGGLLAKALGRVPIPGAQAEVAGLELTAERPAGRRHRIDTVIVRPITIND